nr:SdpI family protein [uncultured Oscillibacter sp.]
MSNTKKKIKTAEERQVEIESARIFGKHVSREKAVALLVATLIACALPMVLGIRLWNDIPEIVPTGLIGTDGQDDSMPRAVVVFGLPGLMCLLDLICHGQLWLNQKRMTLPSAAVRLVGRWGFPVISVLFCSGMVFEATGGTLTLPFITPCVLGLVLLLLGAHMWDCPRDAKLALRFSFTECSDEAWRAVHRFAGWLWLAVGLLVIAGVMLTSGSTVSTAVLIVVALLAPVVYGRTRQNR